MLDVTEPFRFGRVTPDVERELTAPGVAPLLSPAELEDIRLMDLSPAEIEDVRLMERAREGDTEAFTLLILRHRAHVATFLYRLCWDREKAEDGAQEVLLRLWLARGRYVRRSRFTTFLYQIAQNYWRDELRRRRARPVEVGMADELCPGSTPLRAPPATEPHHQLFLRYQQWRVRQAISRLPERYRLVFVLAHLEERRLAEVAEILAIPVGTVKSRLNTAVRLLRGWLGTVSGDDDDEM